MLGVLGLSPATKSLALWERKSWRGLGKVWAGGWVTAGPRVGGFCASPLRSVWRDCGAVHAAVASCDRRAVMRQSYWLLCQLTRWGKGQEMDRQQVCSDRGGRPHPFRLGAHAWLRATGASPASLTSPDCPPGGVDLSAHASIERIVATPSLHWCGQGDEVSARFYSVWTS